MLTNRPPAGEAFRWDGIVSDDVEIWLGKPFNSWLPGARKLEIRTTEGLTTASVGDWIIKDGQGAIHITRMLTNA